ncbi:MAG: phosphoribosylformylglycinamidine synthase I [Candidatus Omnitrophota bacterium]
MKRPKACILRTAGTNCDRETAYAFLKAGAEPSAVHINSFISARDKLDSYQILAIPGGFSYGDDVAAGKILANELKCKLREKLEVFISSGKPIIGICNGFQVLIKCGLLPGNSGLEQEASLFINDSGRFEDRWVYLKNFSFNRKQKCIWTKGLPGVIYLPVAHGEGKFVARNKESLKAIKKNSQVVFQYCDQEAGPAGYPANPNGSQENIAGICDVTGRILGLMPHPERHIANFQHPRWTAGARRFGSGEGDGLLIFKNGVEYARKL